MPVEFDDRGLRVFGHNVKGLQFYDWDRVLQQEIYLQDDNTLNIGGEAIGGGPVISAGAWLGDDGGGVFRFQPDVPVLISGGIVTEYPDIATALGVAGSGDSVVIPPGTYDESITLVDGVRVVELVSGTVVIHSTSADVAVTTAAGGYINVKEIRCTRSRDSDGKLYAVYANHDTGTCIVVAELIRAENTDTVSPGETFGVAMWGAGTLWVFAKRLEASLDGYQHVFGVDSADGTSYVAAVQILADGGTSEDSLVYGVRNSGGEQYIWARVEAQSEGTAWAGYCTFGEQHIWGDCVASGGAVRGAACEGGLQVIHGNVIGESTKGWMAVGAHVQEGTQRIFGSCRAIGTGLSYGIRLLQDSNAGVQEIWGNVIGLGGGTDIGALVDGSAQAGAVTQRIHGDVIGTDYGAKCEEGTQTITNGRASGGTYDLWQTGGTLEIASVQYSTYSGTITLLAESINALIAELEDTTELTIAAGVITVTQSYHRVDTQSDDASDDLDTINGGTTGRLLVLRPEDGARTVVLKHNTGNIWNPTAADVILDDINDHVQLLYDGSMWTLSGWTPKMGDSLFTRADGLLLLGPYCEMNATEWWSLRQQKATLSGSFRQAIGRWTATRALQVNLAATNLLLNPSFEVNITDFWTAANIQTSERSDTYARFGGYSARLYEASFDQDEIFYSDLFVVNASTDYTLSQWVKKAICTGTGLFGIRWYTAGDVHISFDLVAMDSGTHDWKRYELTAESPATASKARIYAFYFTGVDAATEFEIFLDGVQFEESPYATFYFDGTFGTGFAWTGGAHNSTSTRTKTEVDLDALTGLVTDNDTLSFRIVAQMSYDADATWPLSAPLLFDIRGADNNNRIMFRYATAVDEFYVYINGAERITNGSTQTFEVGDWVDLVVTLDFANDEYYSYVNGVLDGSDTTVLAAPTLTDWGVGAYFEGTDPSGLAFEEFAVFDCVLTPNEVAALYAQSRPLIDLGAWASPGVVDIATQDGGGGWRPVLQADYNKIVLNNVPFRVATGGADPAVEIEDGMLFYRTDTDKLRLRANGAWVNLN